MAYDYPGYGKSTGFPYKENVDEFSKLFYEHIQSEKGINEENLILWGYSVGTAVVSDFASKNNFEKLILVSPLASRYDMSEKLF
jgi:pimeloyl-ACP methyl ester carboxylesterase|tara:strand:- start:88 stop:339 length:252 start_codon:yes stop_codon:yes gene_type:complete